MPYALPLRIPYRWAKGTQLERHGLWVSCTVEGHTGWGETAPAPHLGIRGDVLAFQAQALLDEASTDLSPDAALDALEAEPRLRHGLVCAWLDALARKASMGLGSFLAARYAVGRHPAKEVPVNALIGAVEATEAARLAREAVAAGFGTLKVKSDGDPRRDIARLTAIRTAVGPRPRLRLDANEAWDTATALDTLRRLEPLGLEYVEQPVRSGRFQELVDLARRSPVPIALDESMTGWPVAEHFLQAGVRPTLILKPQRLGGPDRVLDVLARAARAGLPCVITNSLETAVGRAHALHLASLMAPPVPDCGLATEGFLASDAATGPVTVRGVQAVPTAAGLGLEVLHASDVRG